MQRTPRQPIQQTRNSTPPTKTLMTNTIEYNTTILGQKCVTEKVAILYKYLTV